MSFYINRYVKDAKKMVINNYYTMNNTVNIHEVQSVQLNFGNTRHSLDTFGSDLLVLKLISLLIYSYVVVFALTII